MRALVTEYAGDGYGEGTGRKTVLNLTHRVVEAYMLFLAANPPKVLISTRHPSLRAFAAHFQIALNNVIEEIKLIDTIRNWVLDAFFCVGFIKLHMANSAPVELELDVYADPGKPFISNVSIDNWFHDTDAKKWGEMQFCGDAYRVPMEDLQDADVYDQKAAKEVKPTSRHELDSERLENIHSGQDVDDGEFMPMTDLIDVYVRRDGKIYTFAADLKGGELKPYGDVLAEMEWDGAENGCYLKLGFGDVPENIIPTSPIQHLAVLERNINNLYLRNLKDARDYKEVTAYQPGSEGAANELKNAKHGDSVCVQDTRDISVMRFGGVTTEQVAFLRGMLEDFNEASGNVSAMMGLGPQSRTVGQDKLIHGAVGGRTESLGLKVLRAIREAAIGLGHMVWHDEYAVIPGVSEMPGMPGYEVDSTWTPDMREGNFIDYNLDIDVYSHQYKSPTDRGSVLTGIIGGVFMPLIETLQSQGGVIDCQELSEALAELNDAPRLRRIIKFSEPLPPDAALPGPVGKPANTTRKYIHESTPSAQVRPDAAEMMAQAAASSEGPPAAEGSMQ